MSAPLLEADTLGFVDNLYCRDSGVICDRLEGGKGVRFLTDAQTTHGNSLVFFTDPDGNILHLLHREFPLP
jgi:hypothetical protein